MTKINATTDTTWGTENNELTTPAILFWRRPGVDISVENPTGAVAHNTEVEVLDRKKYKGHWFVKCRVEIEFEGEKYIQRGWCMDSLLKNRGK